MCKLAGIQVIAVIQYAGKRRRFYLLGRQKVIANRTLGGNRMGETGLARFSLPPRCAIGVKVIKRQAERMVILVVTVARAPLMKVRSLFERSVTRVKKSDLVDADFLQGTTHRGPGTFANTE